MDTQIRGIMESCTPVNGRRLRAVIVIPPVHDFYFTPHRFSLLGPLIVADILRSQGWETALIDGTAEGRTGFSIDLPPALSYLSDLIIENETGPLAFFTRYRRFGMPVEELADRIISAKPDLCCISCFAFCYADEVIRLAAAVKRRAPALAVIAGGAGVSAYPGYFLRSSAIDFAFAGEAEPALAALLRVFTSGAHTYGDCPNLWWKTGGDVCAPRRQLPTTGPDIDPRFSALVPGKNADTVSVSLSRGCPKMCRFCSNRISHGSVFRHAQPDRIRESVEMLAGRVVPGKKLRIILEDDNLMLDPAFTFDTMRMVRSIIPSCEFTMENGIDYMMLDRASVGTLVSLGMKQFNISLCSSDTSQTAGEQRPGDLARYEAVVDEINVQGIPSITYFICGLKHDTADSVADTLAYLGRQPTLSGISLFYPVPGIIDFTNYPVFDDMASCLCAGSSAYAWNRSLSTEQLVTAFRLSRYVNLLKKKTHSEEELQLIRKSAETTRLHTVVKEGGARRIMEVPRYDRGLVELTLARM